MKTISKHDREILRELAKKRLEIAKSSQMLSLKKDWLAHNTFKGGRPMVTVETGTFLPSILPVVAKCEGEFARSIESTLWNTLFNSVYFKDDTVIEDFYPIAKWIGLKPFGIRTEANHADNSLGHAFKAHIVDLEADFHKLKKSEILFDAERIKQQADDINDIFGDILPARVTGTCLYACLTQDIVHIMSMEDMLYAMYDYPELFMQMLDKLSNDYAEMFLYAESVGLLPTTKSEFVAQGSYAFTDELKDSGKIKVSDVWGFFDSQETVGVSPDMFREMIFPYYERLANMLGLVSYGCCEGVHPHWDNCLSKLKNLRKVSISPWCDEEFMGERLRGGNVIFHRKPSPNYLGVGNTLDEDGLRAHFDKTVKAAQGCKLEFTQRDVYNVAGVTQVARYVEILRESCDAHK